MRKERLPTEQRRSLEALPGWVWNTNEASWEKGFTQLEQFVATEGHARVPSSYVNSDGHRLGPWVMNQRTRRAQLSPRRRTRLEALDGWMWKAR